MKRYLPYIPPLMLLIAPMALLATIADYEWVLASERGFAVVFALLFFVAVFGVPKEEVPAAVAVATVPLSVVNLYIWLFAAQDWSVIMLFLACAVVSVRLLKYGQLIKWGRILSVVISLLLFVPYLLLLPIAAFGFAVGETTVVETVYSPNGVYRAELLDVDQGALGGDTVVQVYDEDKGVDFGFVQLRKRPQRVYMGPWGEFEDMELYWESDEVLRINGTAYEIEE